MVHFNAGDVTFVDSNDTNSNEIKFRGGELTRIIKELVNADELLLLANETIEFDFMATPANDPLPTPVGLTIKVESASDTIINIELVE